MVDLAAAYQACARASRAHYENFPVASRLLPARTRPHVAAIYAFARAADDFADEGQRSVAERHRLLDRWQCRLREALAGAAPAPAGPEEPVHTPEIFVALAASVRSLQLPATLLEDLLSAFRQDTVVTRYDTWEALFDYCRRSANPIGRLVLRISGYADRELDGWSDSICTALQLTNFWQDFAGDYARGRLYLPLEEIHRSRADERSLALAHLSVEWKQALASAVRRTRGLFAAGLPLCDRIDGRLRFELRATWLGGSRILDRIEDGDYEIFRRRPTLGVADVPRLAGSALLWPLIAKRYRVKP